MTQPSDERSEAVRFKIFRGADSRDCDLMTYVGMEASAAPRTEEQPVPAMDSGNELKVLFDMPGLSLVKGWLKSEFPLPRHTHDADCLYYIIGGSIRMGDQELGRGDGFFVGADVPYTYTVGPAGVEVLEFRTSNDFDMRVPGDIATLARKSYDRAKARQDAWKTEPRPSSLQE